MRLFIGHSSPVTRLPSITALCIFPMAIYPMTVALLHPVSGHFYITAAAPYPLGTYPDGASIGCRTRSTHRDCRAKGRLCSYKLCICSENRDAEQHYRYKHYFFHSVVLKFLPLTLKQCFGLLTSQMPGNFFTF